MTMLALWLLWCRAMRPRVGDVRDGMEGSIHYVESGKGHPAVVFLPGLT